MPSGPERFNEVGTAPAILREEAEGLEDTAEAIMWVLNRGHLRDSGMISKAMDLHNSLRTRANDLYEMARKAEAEANDEEGV